MEGNAKYQMFSFMWNQDLSISENVKSTSCEGKVDHQEGGKRV